MKQINNGPHGPLEVSLENVYSYCCSPCKLGPGQHADNLWGRLGASRPLSYMDWEPPVEGWRPQVQTFPVTCAVTFLQHVYVFFVSLQSVERNFHTFRLACVPRITKMTPKNVAVAICGQFLDDSCVKQIVYRFLSLSCPSRFTINYWKQKLTIAIAKYHVTHD